MAARWQREVGPLLERLVSIDSVNPTLVAGGAGEREIAGFVAAWLEQRGVAVDLDEVAPGRANVVGRVPGRGGGRSLLLNAHLDTVGLGGPDAGLRPRLEDGRMYGRGAYDMKGGLAAVMLAAAAAAELALRGDVVVAAVADEEAESIGASRLAGALSVDGAIVAEPTGLAMAVAHRGFVWLEIETEGRAAHGSRYDLGVDAIARMGPALSGIAELDRRLRSRTPHPLLGHASLHASLIEGGQDLATYPARCLVRVERRTLPGEEEDAVVAELASVAPGARVRSVFARDPLETAPDAAVAQALGACAARRLDAEVRPAGVPYWTDAAVFAAAGIPSVVFGPGGDGAHTDCEWVRLSDVAETAAILFDTAAAFCA